MALALAVIAVFVATVAILLRLLPGPHKPTDYLVIGAAATFLAMLVLFVGLIRARGKRSDPFYKKRRPSV